MRLTRILIFTGILGFLAAGIWLRVHQLGRYPELDGDEAWHAVQLTKMLRGESFSIWTVTGLPLSPFHAALELPVLLLLPRSLAILRIPTVVTGLLAVVLLYVLGQRLVGRRAAIIGAVLLAVLPVAVLFSRAGFESSHAPLYALLLIALADRLRVWSVAALLACAYFVHPMTILILPVPAALVISRTLQEDRREGREVACRLTGRLTPMCLVVLALGLWTLSRPETGKLAEVYGAGLRSLHDPWLFLRRLGRFFLGLGDLADSWVEPILWTIVGLFLATAVARLYRRRRWGPLALIAGTILSALALFLVGGSNILQPGMTRYGGFLIVPGVLCLAVAADAIARIPSGRGGQVVRLGYLTLGLAIGSGLVLSMRLDQITPQRVLAVKPLHHGGPSGGRGPWLHPSERALAQIRAVLDHESATGSQVGRPWPGRRLIVADGGQLSVLRYLAMDRGDLEVVDFLKLDRDADHWFPRLRNLVAQGAFAVGDSTGLLTTGMTAFLPGARLERRVIPMDEGRRLVLHHLRSEISPWQPIPGDFDGDGRSDLALQGFESSDWRIQLTTGPRLGEVFGRPGQGIPAPADYDGDGRTDLAVYVPDVASWHVQGSGGGHQEFCWGTGGAIPVPGDYEGAGRAVAATFAPSIALWTIPGRPEFHLGLGYQFGGAPIPVPGDYDGDGQTDPASFDANTATWSIDASREGTQSFVFGTPGATPVSADYDGDGRTDPAVFDPADGTWTIRQSATNDTVRRPGMPGLIPVPGDFDGDGRADLVLYDPSQGDWRQFAGDSSEAVVTIGEFPEIQRMARTSPATSIR